MSKNTSAAWSINPFRVMDQWNSKMSFRVQKEIEGKKGRPIRVDVDPDGIINDVVEISLSLFKFGQ